MPSIIAYVVTVSALYRTNARWAKTPYAAPHSAVTSISPSPARVPKLPLPTQPAVGERQAYAPQ